MDLEGQKQIQEHFERMYRGGHKPWVDHLEEPLLDEFIQLLNRKYRQAKVLDLGCGDGWISIRGAKEGHLIWGIDSSKTAIAEAKIKARALGVTKSTSFQVGNVLNLPYSDNFFDVLIDRGLFHHILLANRDLYLENILKVLKPKSFFYLSVFSTRNSVGIGQLFSKELIKKLFGKHFEIMSYNQDQSDWPAHLLHFILKRR